MRATFQRPHKLSMGVLPQQSPLRLADERMAQPFNALETHCCGWRECESAGPCRRRFDWAPSQLHAGGAGCDQVQNMTAHSDGSNRLVLRNPGVLHNDCPAKYALDFFRQLRSILTRASSVRSQLQSIWCGMPSTLEVVAMSCPPLTHLTASSLNSGLCLRQSIKTFFASLLLASSDLPWLN